MSVEDPTPAVRAQLRLVLAVVHASEGVDADHAEAGLSQGVLTVSIPKTPEVKPRKIEVKKLGAKGEKVEVVATDEFADARRRHLRCVSRRASGWASAGPLVSGPFHARLAAKKSEIRLRTRPTLHPKRLDPYEK